MTKTVAQMRLNIKLYILFFSPMVLQPNAGHGLLILDEVSRSRTTVSRNPLDEWSVRRRDLYLTKHNRQTSVPPAGFVPTISAGEWPQTCTLEHAATGTGKLYIHCLS